MVSPRLMTGMQTVHECYLQNAALKKFCIPYENALQSILK